MIPKDPVVDFIQQKTNEAWMAIVRERRDTKPTYFQVASVKKALLAAQAENLRRRQMELEQLKVTKFEVTEYMHRFRHGLTALDEELEAVHTSSENLAGSTKNLSDAFAEITNSLDSATSAVSRASLITTYLKDIQCFNKNTDLQEALKDLRAGNTSFPLDRLDKASEYVAKLIKIVSITESRAQIDNAKRNLAAYKDMLVEQQLRLVESGTQTPEELKKVVQSLVVLGNGEMAIKRWIANTKVFGGANERVRYTPAILDMNDESIQSAYGALCRFVSDGAKTIWRDMDIIFDRTQQVKQKFIQDVFSELLNTFVHNVLEYFTLDDNRLKRYCKMFAGLYSTTKKMCETIGALDNPPSEFSSILEKNFHDYQTAYGEAENKNLGETMHSMIKQPLDTIKPWESSSGARKRNQLVNPFTVFDSGICPAILQMAMESWQRCVLLSPANHVSQNLKRILDTTINNSLKRYISAFLNACVNYLDTYQPDVVGEFLKLVSMCNSAILNLEGSYSTSLKAILTSHSALHSEFLRDKSKMMDELESKIVEGLQKCIDMACEHGRKILDSKQSKSDFTPSELRNQEASLGCREFCSFMRDLIENQLKPHISGKENTNSIFTILGCRLYKTLTTHLLQYSYSLFGGQVLAVDVCEYGHAFDLFGIPLVSGKILDLAKIAIMIHANLEVLGDTARNALPFNDVESIDLAKKLLKKRKDASKFDVDELFGDIKK